MKTLKNPETLIAELASFGLEDYVVYSPLRKEQLASLQPLSGGDAQAFNIDKLEIGRKLAASRQIIKTDSAASAIEAFINES